AIPTAVVSCTDDYLTIFDHRHFRKSPISPFGFPSTSIRSAPVEVVASDCWSSTTWHFILRDYLAELACVAKPVPYLVSLDLQPCRGNRVHTPDVLSPLSLNMAKNTGTRIST